MSASAVSACCLMGNTSNFGALFIEVGHPPRNPGRLRREKDELHFRQAGKLGSTWSSVLVVPTSSSRG